MLFKIINPSDPYTMEAESKEVAAAAIMLIGRGQLGVESEDGEDVLSLLAFAPSIDVNAWFTSTYGRSFSSILDGAPQQVAAALESVVIASFNERKAYADALELIDDTKKKLEFRDRWHDRMRSSMNDIGACAWSVAKRLRERDGNKVQTRNDPGPEDAKSA